MVNLLLKKKFKKDDRVLIISNNRTEVFIIQFAVSYLGGVSSMIDDNLKDNALNYIINDFDPKFLFIDKKKNIPVQIKQTSLQKFFFNDLKFKKKSLNKIVFKRIFSFVRHVAGADSPLRDRGRKQKQKSQSLI